MVTLPGSGRLEMMRRVHFFAWLVGVLVVTLLLGQHVALPLFIAFILSCGGIRVARGARLCRRRPRPAGALFDYMSPTDWYPALLLR